MNNIYIYIYIYISSIKLSYSVYRELDDVSYVYGGNLYCADNSL